MPDLLNERCVACRRDAPRVTDAEIRELKPSIPEWELIEREGIPASGAGLSVPGFQNGAGVHPARGRIGRRRGPPPRALTEWGRVTVTWWTNKIRGLHRNDFLMAAKTDRLAAE